MNDQNKRCKNENRENWKISKNKSKNQYIQWQKDRSSMRDTHLKDIWSNDKFDIPLVLTQILKRSKNEDEALTLIEPVLDVVLAPKAVNVDCDVADTLLLQGAWGSWLWHLQFVRQLKYINVEVYYYYFSLSIDFHWETEEVKEKSYLNAQQL